MNQVCQWKKNTEHGNFRSCTGIVRDRERERQYMLLVLGEKKGRKTERRQ